MADARPPGNPDAYKLRYVLEHRKGTQPLASRFVHVFEPYVTQPLIDGVDRIALDEAAEERGALGFQIRMGTLRA